MCFYIVPSFITCSITSDVRKKLQSNIVSEKFNASLFTVLSSFPLIRQHVHPGVCINFDPNVTIDEEILERVESQPIKRIEEKAPPWVVKLAQSISPHGATTCKLEVRMQELNYASIKKLGECFCNRISDLSFWRVDLNDGKAKLLADCLPRLQRLRALELDDNQITKDGFKAIA